MRKSFVLHQSANRKFNSPFLTNGTSIAEEKTCHTIMNQAWEGRSFQSGPTLVVRNTETSESVYSAGRTLSSRRCIDTAETARQSASGTKRSITDIMRLVNQGSTVGDGNNDAKKLRIESPIKTLSPNATRHNISTSSVPSSGSQNVKNNDDVALNSSTSAQKLQTNGTRYFSVLWCKLSAKKHKKWEGDAVLIVKGRSAQLKSLEGKELGSTFGYKVTDVESIEEGSHFKVGGKECEIQGPITAEDYLSGRCFSEGFVPDDKSTGAAAPSHTSRN